MRDVLLRLSGRGHWRRLVAMGLVAATIAAGCGNTDDDDADEPEDTTEQTDDGEVTSITGVPGVTDEEIHFSAIGIRSNNPLGTCVLDCYVDGIEAYFAWRNSEGGVHGRQLVLDEPLDDELTNNKVRALEVLTADDTFANFNATQIPDGWSEFVDAGVPMYVWGIHFGEMNGRESIFGFQGGRCTVCTSRFTIYPAVELGATKAASLGYGVSPASQECSTSNKNSIEKYSDDIGVTFEYENGNLDFGLPNGIAPEVTAMKDAGVDVIFGCLDLNGMKTLAQELERQGMGDVPMVHNNTYDADFVAEAGDLFEGDIVGVSFRPFESDPGDTQLADFNEWMEETGADVTELAMFGWINADTAYQGLLAAGEDFDREKVIAATNEMTEYTAGGLVNPIDWSRQHNAPTEDDPFTNGYVNECFSYVRVAGGEFELVGDPEKPFFCWDGSTQDWSEPEMKTFE